MKNLKVSHKLFISFSVLLIIVIIGGIIQNWELSRISTDRYNIQTSTKVSDNLQELRFLYCEDRLLLMEIMNPEDINELAAMWVKHDTTKSLFSRTFSKISESLNKKDWAIEYDSTKKSISEICNRCNNFFIENFSSSMEKVYSISNELINLKDQESVLPDSSDEYISTIAKIPQLALEMQKIDASMDSIGDIYSGDLIEAIRLSRNIVTGVNSNSESFATKCKTISLTYILISVVLVVGLAAMFFQTISKQLIQPITRFRDHMKEFSKGNIPGKIDFEGSDEIGEMVVAVNELGDNLLKTVDFANDVGAGQIDTQHVVFNNEGILGKSLANMRDSLRNVAKEREEQEKIEAQRNWLTQGIAKFGEVIRNNTSDMEELSYTIISELVKYLKANQGGMFVVKEQGTEKILELQGAYAYERRKILERIVHEGEGLVGTCFLEKETIFMTDLPDSYMSITSGLGSANPSCLVIVPIKVNDEIYGIFEIASFEKFEAHHVELIEKAGEITASAIATTMINTKTNILLRESKEQAEKLAQQEEEMRQNMEEMMATQEETGRREQDLIVENKRLREELEALRG